MKEKILKGFRSLAAVVLVAAMVLGHAVPLAYATEAQPPTFSGGAMFRDPSFIGVRAGIVNQTLAAIRIDDNDQGLLYAVCRHSVTEGDYAVAFDYYTADPFDDQINLAHSGRDGDVITPYVYTGAVDTDYYAESVRGCWVPPWPVRYESGLIGINNSATGYSLYYYRTDDGQNPH